MAKCLTSRQRSPLDRARPSIPALLFLILTLAFGAATAEPLDAVVGVRSVVPADARTAEVLGTRREGSGVVIGEGGLVLTIGYLIMEAESAELLLPEGRVLPAEILAYDYDSGFGLLRALADPGLAAISLGESKELDEETQVLVASFKDGVQATPAYVVSRREFAGYWEYLLPQAIFTTPPHRDFGGASLLGRDGRLLGIGSLMVGDAAPERNLPGNMFVPIDALKPILGDLLEKGRAARAARLFVARVAPEGPAAMAGLLAEDLVVAVAGAAIGSQADFYRQVWAQGAAGVVVPITVLRGSRLVEVEITSGDRYDYLKLSRTY